MLRSRPFHCKKCDFRCFGPARGAHARAGFQRAWPCALSQLIREVAGVGDFPLAAARNEICETAVFAPWRVGILGASAPPGLDVNAVGHAPGAGAQKRDRAM